MARTVRGLRGDVQRHRRARPARRGHAPRSRRRDYTADLTRGVDGLRIGVVPGYFFHHLQPPVDAAVRGALKTLEGLGARVVDVEIDHIHGNISAQLTDRVVRAEHLPPALAARAAGRLRRGRAAAARARRAATWRRTTSRRSATAACCAPSSSTPSSASTCSSARRCRSPPRACGETTVQIENGVEEDMLSAIMQFTGVPVADRAAVARGAVRVRRRRPAGRHADHRPAVRRGAAVPCRRRVPGRHRLPHPDAGAVSAMEDDLTTNDGGRAARPARRGGARERRP